MHERSHSHSEQRREHTLNFASLSSLGKDGGRLLAVRNDGGDTDEASSKEMVGMMDQEKPKEEVVTWRSLPHRKQLIILTLARLSEPLVQTSLQVCLNIIWRPQ